MNKEISNIAKNGEATTAKERVLVDIWSQVLKTSNIGVYDDFYKLGGTSVDVLKILKLLSPVFEISLNEIFSRSTIAEISPVLKYKKNGIDDDIINLKGVVNKFNNYKYSNEYRVNLNKYREKINNISFNVKNYYKNILITGGNGYFACHIIWNILMYTKTNVFIIVRGKNDLEAYKRLEKAFNWYFEEEDLLNLYKNRIQVISGDISEQCLGIDGEKYEELSKTIDCVVHAAGLIRHYGLWEDFERANIIGTKEVIKFAKYKKNKNLNFISTIGVAYTKERMDGNRPFTEYESIMGEQVDNYYIKSKLIAEQMVEEAFREGISGKIFRLGFLVQSNRTGKFQIEPSGNAFFGFLSAFKNIGYIPDEKTKIFDFSFVDQTAEAVFKLLNVDENNKVYHIMNPNKISIYDFGEMAREITPKIKISEIDEFFKYVKKNINNLSDEISKIILLTNIHEKDLEQTLVLGLQNDKTNTILSKLGFEWAKVDINKIKNIFKVI